VIERRASSRGNQVGALGQCASANRDRPVFSRKGSHCWTSQSREAQDTQRSIRAYFREPIQMPARLPTERLNSDVPLPDSPISGHIF